MLVVEGTAGSAVFEVILKGLIKKYHIVSDDYFQIIFPDFNKGSEGPFEWAQRDAVRIIINLRYSKPVDYIIFSCSQEFFEHNESKLNTMPRDAATFIRKLITVRE